MLDIKDFSFFEKQNSFDFKSFLIKIVSYWKWFLISLIVTFSIAHQVNVRKQKIFGVGTTIAVKVLVGFLIGGVHRIKSK